MERENGAPTVGLEMNSEIMDFASPFKYLGCFFSDWILLNAEVGQCEEFERGYESLVIWNKCSLI